MIFFLRFKNSSVVSNFTGLLTPSVTAHWLQQTFTVYLLQKVLDVRLGGGGVLQRQTGVVRALWERLLRLADRHIQESTTENRLMRCPGDRAGDIVWGQSCGICWPWGSLVGQGLGGRCGRHEGFKRCYSLGRDAGLRYYSAR